MTSAAPAAVNRHHINPRSRVFASLLADRLTRLAEDVENACALMVRSNLREATPAMVSCLAESRREVAAAYERLEGSLPEGEEKGRARGEAFAMGERPEKMMRHPDMLRTIWKPSMVRGWAERWREWAGE